MANLDHAEMTVRIAGTVPVSNSSNVASINVSEVMDESAHVAGSVLQPTAGQAICTMPPLPAGLYRVDIHRMAGGSGTPTLFNNGEFRSGALVRTLPSVAVLEIPYTFTFFEQLNGAEAMSVNAVNAGSANITIVASITATRIK